MKYNWYRVQCHNCGMDKEFPIDVIDGDSIAVPLAIVFHDRNPPYPNGGCRFGDSITVSIVEKDVILNV